MTRHKHADLMIAYANDTSLAIQMNDGYNGWRDLPVNYNPSFSDTCEYRIKPKEAEKGDFICEIDGVKWWLGPESEEEMSWGDAKEWAEQQGCVLPPREVLLMCYIKEDIRKQFKEDWYWSGDEYERRPAGLSWRTAFTDGAQGYNFKDNTFDVRGVISS